MLISVHDKSLKRVGFLDNDKPDTTHFTDDTWHRYLTEATSTFDFTIPKASADPDVLSAITDQSYVSFSYEGHDHLFNIMQLEETEDEIIVKCENLNLELVTETERAHDANGQKTFEEYIKENQIDFAQFKIGINEVASNKRTLSWDGTSTKLERLLSIANSFDAEVEFETHLNRDGTLKDITLNVYQKHDDNHQGVGTRRNDVTLFYGKNLKSIRRKVDKTGLYTAIRPLGTDDLTIKNLDKTVKDADGRVLYQSPKGDEHILAPQSREKYPAQLQPATQDNYVNLEWSYDTKDVDTLYSKGLAKLKEICEPAITYEIEGTEQLDIGDTVQIHDDGFSPTLLLEARVSEQEISFSDPTKNVNKYANARELENKLSSSILSRVEEIRASAAPYIMTIYSDNGTVLRKKSDSTTLTARVTKGDKDVTSTATITWTVDDTTVSTDASVTITGLTGKKVYKAEATDATGNALCSAEVTVYYIGDAVQLNILSSAGTVFKNSTTATVLRLEIVVGGTKITSYADAVAYFGDSVTVTWRYNKLGESGYTTISSTDSRLSDSGFQLSLTGIDDQTVFECDMTY